MPLEIGLDVLGRDIPDLIAVVKRAFGQIKVALAFSEMIIELGLVHLSRLAIVHRAFHHDVFLAISFKVVIRELGRMTRATTDAHVCNKYLQKIYKFLGPALRSLRLVAAHVIFWRIPCDP
jgi:hypothetical protein